MRALILAGGGGTRFWPLSRKRLPKQLLALDGERTLLQTTLERLAPLVPPEGIWVCTTAELAAQVRRQLPGVPASQILAEPVGRNTAAAIGWAVRSMPPEARREVIAVLPADHRIADPEAFRATLELAATLAGEQERILTLGVTPRWPETGYGYLELGEVLEAARGLRRVRRFTEKPDPPTARRFFEGGDHLWNAGIFVFAGTLLLEKLSEHQPVLARGLDEIASEPERSAEIYPRLPAVSIDHGVMEKLDDLATLPLDCGWDDLGSWAALWEVLVKDSDGNVERGSVVSVDCRDNLLYAEQGTVAALGVSGLVVVRTGDTVLVVSKERSQEVRRLVAELEPRGLQGLL
ncbi:MAG: mannose-1-phosphate guanylyltransferase [Thermoanaerobaculia bacterium]